MKNSFWDKIQNINSKVLYLVLVLTTSIPLFISGTVIPTNVSDSTAALFVTMNNLKEGDVVAIESDWTLSSRGESAGQLEAVLRILHAKKCKFVLFSMADAQAPQVARNVIARLNLEFKGSEFKQWEDYVDLKFFPQAESMALSMKGNLRQAWSDREAIDPSTNKSRKVFESPVLANINSLKDLKLYTIVTASGTPQIIIQRFGNPSDVPIIAMVTGVMGPETRNYYVAGQLKGLTIGLRGVAELETAMAKGVNYSVDGKEPAVKLPTYNGSIPPMEGVTFDRGMKYFASLHVAMFMLIFAVILGNLGMIAKRKGASK